MATTSNLDRLLIRAAFSLRGAGISSLARHFGVSRQRIFQIVEGLPSERRDPAKARPRRVA